MVLVVVRASVWVTAVLVDVDTGVDGVGVDLGLDVGVIAAEMGAHVFHDLRIERHIIVVGG